MPNNYFRFKQFTVLQEQSAMKVCTDACLFGAWVSASQYADGTSMLDIGTGTGLLSLMLAQKTTAYIDAIEIDRATAEEAKMNFEASGWASRLHVFHTAVQKYKPGKLYDLIVSNPPFFRDDLNSPDAKRNVALHGTSLSLRELFEAVVHLLEPAGYFALLVSARRGEEAERTAANHEFTIAEKVHIRQTPEHAPFRIMYLFQSTKTNSPSAELQGAPAAEEIVIKMRSGNTEVYSPEFAALLKDYYLYL